MIQVLRMVYGEFWHAENDRNYLCLVLIAKATLFATLPTYVRRG